MTSFPVYFSILLGASTVPLPPAEPEEQAKIEHVFASYLEALSTRDGAAALSAVDRSTVAYYDELRMLALHGSQELVRMLPLADQYSIFILRAKREPERLKAYTGGEALKTAVDAGWVGTFDRVQLSLKDIRVAGEFATATLMVSTQPGGQIEFSRESSEWRVNLVSVLMRTRSVIGSFMRHEEGGDDEQALMSALERTAEVENGRTLWDPPDPIPDVGRNRELRLGLFSILRPHRWSKAPSLARRHGAVATWKRRAVVLRFFILPLQRIPYYHPDGLAAHLKICQPMGGPGLRFDTATSASRTMNGKLFMRCDRTGSAFRGKREPVVEQTYVYRVLDTALAMSFTGPPGSIEALEDDVTTVLESLEIIW